MKYTFQFKFTGSVVFAAAMLLISSGFAGESGSNLLFAPSVEVLSFKVVAQESRANIIWQTALEQGVDAFRVTRRLADGTDAEVGCVRARRDEGGAYELADADVPAGRTAHYDLWVVSGEDSADRLMSWEGVVEAAPKARPALMAPSALTAAAASTARDWIGSGDRVRTWTGGLPADRVRLSLKTGGIYRVTAQELAEAGGWSVAAVTNAISGTNVSLSCQGEPVAWLADGDALLFHGLPAESRWAPENVYWVTLSPGVTMSNQTSVLTGPATTNTWFMDEVRYQGTNYTARPTYSSLADSPAPYLAERLLTAGTGWQVTQAVVNCAGGAWTGEVRVNLLSYYEAVTVTDAHEAKVSVGGVAAGDASWTDEQYVTFSYPFSSTNLAGATAILKIQNLAPNPPGDDFTRFLWISHSVRYARLYLARNDALRCTGGPGNTVAVSGFSTNDLTVLDVTVSNLPVVINPVDIAADGVSSNWSAAFACGDTNRIYQVCSRSAGTKLPSVRGVRDVDWTSASNAVDYAILIPPEGWMEGYRAPMQELADFRSAQGLVTRVIDVESLYNRFSQGLMDAGALQQFCAAGRTNWGGRPLRYLLLAADGSLDFKHDLYTAGADQGWFIPTLLAGQRFSGGEGMTSAIDAAIGDVDGDGVPDVAIGRIPAGSVRELQTVVDKTKAYEGVLVRTNGVLAKGYWVLSPDWNNTPGTPKYYTFDAALDRLIAPIEAANRIYVPARAQTNDPSNMAWVKTNILIPEFKKGTGLFHFLGHSNKQRLGYLDSTRLLHYTDFSATNDWHPPVGVFMGCQANVWQWLSTSATLAPVGLFATNSGFVAVLGSTGYLLADESEALAVHMYTAAAEQGILRLGDMLNEGLRGYFANPLDPGRLPTADQFNITGRLQCLSLIGDPALVIRHDVTATGTDVEWLVAHGLTSANADVQDPDADGWPTWREFEDGTNPTGNVFQIHSARLTESAGLPTFVFETVSSGQYQMEFASSLLSNDWYAVSWSLNGVDWNPADTKILPVGPLTTVILPGSTITKQGFFRVRTAY